MAGIYSFIQPPLMHLLGISGKVLPGIEKSIALLYNDKTKTSEAYIYINPTNIEQIDPLFVSDTSFINDLRTKNKQVSWLTAKNLPFETVEQNRTQLNIFDEYENTVLCLPFRNLHDNKFDLLFLYLNKNKANFGLANSDVPLTTNEKDIIGKTLHHSLNQTYCQHNNDSQVLKQMNKQYQNTIQENAKLKAEIEHLKANYNYSQVTETKKIINQLSIEQNIKISLSKEAIQKIQNYTGSFDDLKQSVKASTISSINRSFGLNNPEIILSAIDINFIESPKIDQKIIEERIPSRFYKTVHLLDKLENAAKVVMDSELKLTSENVGNACPIPISAPAISDALKNHHNKVLKLMNDYPERWPLIKKEFRPIKNIMWSNTG